MDWENRFWHSEEHTQRIATKDWREALLDNRDKIIVKGHIRQLLAKNLGYGVVEVSLQPLSEVGF